MLLKYTDYLFFVKKKRVNKKLYLIQLDYLSLSKTLRNKNRQYILNLDTKFKFYINNKNCFSDSDLELFEIKLKKLIEKTL